MPKKPGRVLRFLLGWRPEDTYRRKLVTLGRASLAELTGTAAYVFLSVMVLQSPVEFPVALVAGITMAFIVITFVKTSGGHHNPAISLAVCLIGKLPFLFLPCYVLAQLVGSLIGAILSRIILLQTPAPGFINSSISMYSIVHGGVHRLKEGVSPGPAILVEAVNTCIMVLVFLITIVDRKNKTPFGPMAVGFAVTSGIVAGFPTSSGSMNPARSFGPAVIAVEYYQEVWKNHYVYWVGPGCGALVASLSYWVLFSSWKTTRKVPEETPCVNEVEGPLVIQHDTFSQTDLTCDVNAS